MRLDAFSKRTSLATYLFVFGVTLCTFSHPLIAQDPFTWQPTQGPPGGTVYSFATLSEAALLAGTDNGIYLSLDNGSNWVKRSEGYIDEQVSALMVTHTGVIFAGTNQGLYRSTDAGISWTTLETGLASPSFTALTHGGDSLFAGGPMGVIWSMDNGETWELINEGLSDIRITSLAYTQEGNVLAGTQQGIFQRVQFINEWGLTSNGLTRITDLRINAIIRYDARRLLAATESGVFFSDADFIEWNATIGQFGGEATAKIVDIAVDQAGVIYAATPQVVFRSEDEGVNWESMQRGLPSIASSLQSLNNLHLNSANDLLAGTSYYGIFKYITPIEKWESSTSGLTTQSVSSILINGRGDLLAGTESGLFVSTNQGNTWQQTQVLEDVSGFELLHQDRQGRIFANGSVLLMSEDQGASWIPIRQEKAQAFYVVENNTFIALFGVSNRVLRSTNEGESWGELGLIPSQSAQISAYTFLQDNLERIWVGTSEGIFRSTDQGVTWDALSLGGTFNKSKSLALDSAGHVYVGGNDGLYRSDENGDNFESILEVESGVEEVLVQDDQILVITAAEGIFQKEMQSPTWIARNEGLPPGAHLLTAAVAPSTNQAVLNVYLSVQHAGIYQGIGVIQISNERRGLIEDISIGAFPNPISHSLTIEIHLEASDLVKVDIFDTLGRKIHTLLDSPLPPGKKELVWNTPRLPNGVYFIRVRVGTRSFVRSITRRE